MASDAIIAEELAYWYGELVAVDHISFNVAEGEILGFLGLVLTPHKPHVAKRSY